MRARAASLLGNTVAENRSCAPSSSHVLTAALIASHLGDLTCNAPEGPGALSWALQVDRSPPASSAMAMCGSITSCRSCPKAVLCRAAQALQCFWAIPCDEKGDFCSSQRCCVAFSSWHAVSAVTAYTQVNPTLEMFFIWKQVYLITRG